MREVFGEIVKKKNDIFELIRFFFYILDITNAKKYLLADREQREDLISGAI